MFMTIALLALLLFLLALLLLRPSPAVTPPQSVPLQTRRVSFSLVASDTSYSLHAQQRRWSSPFHKRKSSAPDFPHTPQPRISSVDQLGRTLLPSPPSDMHLSIKSPRRLSLSMPLRLSFNRKRRSLNTSSTSTLVEFDQMNPVSPPSSISATQSPPRRTRFVNLFGKYSRSRALSPPSTLKSPDTSSSNPSVMPSPSSASTHRQTLVSKFRSIFKPIQSEPKSPTIHSKAIIPSINTRLRRKPVARTQPYGPPWNALMPVPDLTLSRHSSRKSPQTMSPPFQTSRRCSVYQHSRPEMMLISPGQLSPRTFISELDEKLSSLQQIHIQNMIPHE